MVGGAKNYILHNYKPITALTEEVLLRQDLPVKQQNLASILLTNNSQTFS